MSLFFTGLVLARHPNRSIDRVSPRISIGSVPTNKHCLFPPCHNDRKTVLRTGLLSESFLDMVLLVHDLRQNKESFLSQGHWLNSLPKIFAPHHQTCHRMLVAPNSRQVRSDAGAVLHSESFRTDSLGRLTETVNQLGNFTAGYTAGNILPNMNTWSRPNGLSTQFDWYVAGDGANALALKGITHSQGGATVSKFGYQYDLQGRISKWTRQLDPSATNQKDWSLGYSRSGELTGVSEKNASSVETSRASWSYDPAGNWYAQGDLSGTTHRTHDSMNRLNQIGGAGKTVVEGTLNEAATVSVSGQAAQVISVLGTGDFNFKKEIPVAQGNNNFQIVATDRKGNARTQNYSVQVGAAQKTYEYDLNGNLLREKDPVGTVIRSFEWDGADKLKAVNWGAQRIEWTYNGMGQRVLEAVNGVASKRFLWDGSALLLEKSPAGAITKKFYGDGEQRVGSTDAGNYFYTRDHLGSVREVVKQDGSLQARYDYDAYGKRTEFYRNSAYLKGCDFGFTGHITLESLVAGQSELLLTHYRAYDPQLGRWLSADPIGEAGGINLYGYVNGNPINGWDPLGLQCWELPRELAGNDSDFIDAWNKEAIKAPAAFLVVPLVVLAETEAAVVIGGAIITTARKVKVDGPKLKPNKLHSGTPTGRICQLRLGNTPIARIDYTDTPRWKSKPVLHFHVWPIMDYHIPLQWPY